MEFLSKSEDETLTKFWVNCYNQAEGNGIQGKILCSLEILPKWKSELCQVGKGRDEPNVAPYLPPPVGRFQFSLNPITLLNQCVGKRFRRKLYCGICLICLFIYLICMIPYIVLHLSGEVVNPFNYIKK